MFDQCEDINGAVVAWLGDQVAEAADEVFSALMGGTSGAGGERAMSGPGAQPSVGLIFMIARHGLPEVLRVLSGLMEGRGDITSTIVRECGAIELWREGQEGPPPEAA